MSVGADGTGSVATATGRRRAAALADPGAPSPDGRSARWDRHRAERRAELVRLARRTVHRAGPDVSMEEIAAAAGTSKSIVYRYFADKTGLQRAVSEAVVAQMHAALDDAARAASTPRDALRAMIDVYLEMIAASPNVYRFVTRPVPDADRPPVPAVDDDDAPLGHFLQAVAELIARPIARVLATGTPDSGLADVWAAGAVGFIRGAGEWWLDRQTPGEEPALARDELTERVTAWLWTGPVSALARGRTAGPTTEPSATSAPLNVEETP